EGLKRPRSLVQIRKIVRDGKMARDVLVGRAYPAVRQKLMPDPVSKIQAQRPFNIQLQSTHIFVRQFGRRTPLTTPLQILYTGSVVIHPSTDRGFTSTVNLFFHQPNSFI